MHQTSLQVFPIAPLPCSLLAGMQGAVANQVETEQLVQVRNGPDDVGMTSSFVQMRGSIPLMWSQIPNIKYKPTTQVAPLADSEHAFDAHVKDLLRVYQVCRRSPTLIFRSTMQLFASIFSVRLGTRQQRVINLVVEPNGHLLVHTRTSAPT